MASMVDAIRTALRSIGEGEITISAYDTAMVALLKNPVLAIILTVCVS